MDELWTMTLLGQEEPSFWRLVAPVIVIGALALFRWLNEKAKQKERQQQAEDDASYRLEDEDGVSRSEPARPEQAQRAQRAPLPQDQAQRRPGGAQPIHRYEPRIPSAPGRAAEPSQVQLRQPERIIMARDLSAETAQKKQVQRQQQQQLRDKAVSQARALHEQRSREAAREKAKVVHRKAVEAKSTGQSSFQKDALPPWGQAISQPQIRRAIVWAEILAAPRSLRPHEEVF